MTTDDILRMAREAGFTELEFFGNKVGTNVTECLERFAALVAAAERDECAKVCDTEYYQHLGPEYGEVRYGISTCATAIRAMGTK